MFFLDSSSDEDEINLERETRRILRNSKNLMDLSDKSVVNRYRVTKEVFHYILDEINLNIGHRSTALSPVIKLASALEVLASGSYQRVAGNDYVVALGQSTVSAVLWEVLDSLEEKLCPKWIKFQPSERTIQHTYSKYNIPGVIGFVDGTHVTLMRPHDNEHAFFNRKGSHSINTMIVCDERLVIMAINPKYGGLSHDSFVWGHSNERKYLEGIYEREKESWWLLGDRGYPVEPWLLTPYRNAAIGSAEAKFNKQHGKARSTVERCIGRLKARWRILNNENTPRYSPEKMAKIINVTAALHNICEYYKIPLTESIVVPEPEDNNGAENHPVNASKNRRLKQIGEHIRDQIRDSLQC